MNAPHNSAQARAWRKRTAAVFAAVGALIFSSGIVMLTAPAASADTKIGVCHRTSNDQNPYRFETVGEAAFNAPKGHATHLAGASAVATWESDGVWNEIEHSAGAPKPDYILGSDGVPRGVATVDDLRAWCLNGQAEGTLVAPEYEPNGACGVHGWVSKPSTNGVSYSIAPGDWDATEGTQTITATLDNKSAEFGGDTSGWKVTGKTAQYEIVLGEYAGDCVVVVSATAPTASAPTCDAPGSLTLPSAAGYEWTGDIEDSVGNHELTAVAKSGYQLTGQTTWTVSVLAAGVGLDCSISPTSVTPLEPNWVEAKCDTDPSVQYNSVEGVRYQTAGDVLAGASVVVTATPEDDRYVLADGAKSVFRHTFNEKPSGIACGGGGSTETPDPVTPIPPTVPNPELISVTPKYASATDATCSRRGALIVPSQPAGVLTSRTGSVPGTVTFTYAPAAGYTFPAGTVTTQQVKVDKKLTGDECILGDEEVKPTPGSKPTRQAKPKPRDRGPVVLGTQAAVPTAVDAGLASLPTSVVSSTGSPRLAQALVAGGLLMLVAGGSMGLGRRTRGAHES